MKQYLAVCIFLAVFLVQVQAGRKCYLKTNRICSWGNSCPKHQDCIDNRCCKRRHPCPGLDSGLRCSFWSHCPKNTDCKDGRCCRRPPPPPPRCPSGFLNTNNLCRFKPCPRSTYCKQGRCCKPKPRYGCAPAYKTNRKCRWWVSCPRNQDCKNGRCCRRHRYRG